MKHKLSKFGASLQRYAKNTSPVIQPLIQGWYELYRNWFVWLYTDSPARGRMVTNAMSRYLWRK